MNKRLHQKAAILTGAGRGIGRATALRFAEEGANLLLVEAQADSLAETAEMTRALGAETVTIVGDVTLEPCASEAREKALQAFGHIDILVNNVGGTRPGKISELTVDDWDWVMAVNLRSTFLFTQAVAPHMQQRGYGKIVCLSSGARNGTVWNAHYYGASAYSAAKAGLHGFVRAMALEFGDSGITINAVAPGPIDTEIAGPFLTQMDQDGLEFAPSRMTPMRRLGTPREVADAILYLASDESSYVTGTTLDVLGGR
jgi:NAD(P)-dependent dehydrogenase (short-subunit alcohol dehydrogenase family)